MKVRIILISLLIAASCGMAHGIPRRAVSLRVLQSTLKSGGSEQAMRMCGITKISGYIVDPGTHDIILFGEVDKSLPALNFDDFVVALRNAWYVYGQTRGNTRYYSAPGCSIDPIPNTLRELAGASNKISQATTPEERATAIQTWKAIGHKPQNVRVMGVPFDSRFARVMVDADFYMKRLANGTVSLQINGFQSMTEMLLGQARLAMASGESVDTGQTMNRFWFCPGDTTFSGEDGVVALRTCPVKLLTEEQFLSTSGVEGYGRPNPTAQRFADGFTLHYKEISAARPIYHELQGLFRLAAIARLMKDERAAETSGFDMRYLLYNRPVAVTPVSRAVTGLADFQELTDDRRVGEEIHTSFYWHMTCGGVSMDIRPRRVATKPKRALTQASTQTANPKATGNPKRTHTLRASSPAPRPTGVKRAVLNARKSGNALYWDVPEVD